MTEKQTTALCSFVLRVVKGTNEHIAGKVDLVVVNPRYVMTVLGTTSDPNGDTGAVIRMADGEEHTVHLSVHDVLSALNAGVAQ